MSDRPEATAWDADRRLHAAAQVVEDDRTDRELLRCLIQLLGGHVAALGRLLPEVDHCGRRPAGRTPPHPRPHAAAAPTPDPAPATAGEGGRRCGVRT